MKLLPLTTLLCLFISFNADAAPFGTSKGTNLSSLKNAEEISNGKYKFSPAKPHPAFETYVALVSEKQGVCWIKAIGKDIQTSTYGTELKSAFESFEAKLSKVYGNKKQYDFLLPDSIWDDPKDYMPALLKKERILGAVWDKEQQSTLKDELSSLTLVASAISRSKGYIALEYAFDNYESCKKELDEAVDDVL